MRTKFLLAALVLLALLNGCALPAWFQQFDHAYVRRSSPEYEARKRAIGPEWPGSG
jgi:hypothetical protein